MKKMSETGISPEVLQEISALAKKHQLEKVILFGSRARGDFWRASDIDLAVSGGDVAGFAVDVDELTSTLLMYDVVDLGKQVQDKLLENIKKDGVVIYGKV